MEFNTARRTCFFEEDDGLASLADMEAGFSGKYQNVNVNNSNKNPSPHIARPVCSTKGGFRSAVATCVPCSPRSGRFYDARFEDFQHPHFLEACFRCRKPLGNNKDIFMYRGDTAFCSEECREEQIEMDEAKEKNWNLSSSMKALRKKDQRKAATSPSKAQDYPFRSNAVAAA